MEPAIKDEVLTLDKDEVGQGVLQSWQGMKVLIS